MLSLLTLQLWWILLIAYGPTLPDVTSLCFIQLLYWTNNIFRSTCILRCKFSARVLPSIWWCTIIGFWWWYGLGPSLVVQMALRRIRALSPKKSPFYISIHRYISDWNEEDVSPLEGCSRLTDWRNHKGVHKKKVFKPVKNLIVMFASILLFITSLIFKYGGRNGVYSVVTY